MSTEIKSSKDLKEDGYYWFADKTDKLATWEVVYVEKDPCSELEDFTDEDEKGEDEVIENWYFGNDKKDCCDLVEEEHIFIGPIPCPEVAVPFESLSLVVGVIPVPTKKVVSLVPPLTLVELVKKS